MQEGVAWESELEVKLLLGGRCLRERRADVANSATNLEWSVNRLHLEIEGALVLCRRSARTARWKLEGQLDSVLCARADGR